MNPISFDTYIRRNAYRNGWDNCEPDADGTGRWLSSTAHEGLRHGNHGILTATGRERSPGIAP